MDNIKTLADLKIGQEAIIDSVVCENKELRSHILDMGLTPNVEVFLIKTAPMGDPIEIRIRGYNLSLRKSEASFIKIKEIHDAHEYTRKKREFISIEHSQKGEEFSYIDKKKKNLNPPKTKIKLALAGNQNSGKTTLFNKLTGSNQRVGNFPGVTVDKAEGIIKGYKDVTLTDLPGIYSLSPYSNEEIVTRNYILKEKPDGIINIVDATNIERNLFLTMQLLELNVPMVIALNMMDEINENGGSIDINGLELSLGVPVVPISASKNEGVDELIEHIVNVAKFSEKPSPVDFCENLESKDGAIHRCLHSISHIIESHAKSAKIPTKFAATKFVENDELIKKSLNLDDNDIETCNQIIKQMEEDAGYDRVAVLANMRFTFIENLCYKYVSKPVETKSQKISQNVDKVLTGKYTAILSFLLIMSFIFFITFGPVGIFLTDLTNFAVELITNFTDSALTSYGLNPVVHSLIINGIFAGVGSVLSFLPVIILLFFFLSLLEDSGYMARVAFVMDKLLRKIGLSGRSFVPMLIGFGCTVPAIMSTRTLPSERDRKMTIFLTPFMSCSAKLPVYVFFTSAFFIRNQVQVILGLYFIGIIVGIIFAYVVKFFFFKGEPVPFVMELPSYRMPTAVNVYRLIYAKAKGFITKAFTIIFWATIIIWFLQSFDSRLNLVTNSANSLLAVLGNMLIPIFKPLGITDWRITTAFITGFMAKESIISTLTVLLGGDIDKLPTVFNQLTAFVFLVFCLLYTPCVATIATVRRELGKRYALLVVLFQCGIAWLVSLIVYNLFKMF